MLGAIATKALHQTAQNQLAVRFKDHVDKVDNNNSTEVAQAQLTCNFFSCFQVIFSNSVFEIATLTNKFTGVNVDHDHRFSAIDN